MNAENGPLIVVWDLTYACPLRCVHCYSESGRRPSGRLGREDMRQVVNAITTMQPKLLVFAGGEPLTVPHLFELAAQATAASVRAEAYTGGWTVTPRLARRAARGLAGIVVSLDGATADVHDRIRGRAGSFDRALRAVELLDSEAGRLIDEGGAPPTLNIDFTVTRSNFGQMAQFCREVVGRFPHIKGVFFGAAVPSGLASRAGFAEHELITDRQAAELAAPELTARLQALVPAGVQVAATDNRVLQMHPSLVGSDHSFLQQMQVEADGAVRAMPMYEGTVGNLLTEPGAELWQRARARRHDPFVVETLEPARTMRQWSEAARNIDRRFASDQVLARIDRRPAYEVRV